MKKILFILLFIVACDNREPNNDNINNKPFSENEFIVLFQKSYPITSFELENGNSIVFYQYYDNLKISEVDTRGEILWTKDHDIEIAPLYGKTFVFNNLIYSYNSNKNGFVKTVFDLTGEVIESESLFSTGGTIVKDNNYLYTFITNYNQSTNTTNINYRQYSLLGNLISEGGFTTDYLALEEHNDIIVRSNQIYIFGKSDFQGSPNYYENFFCRIYDFNGNLINTINSEIQELKKDHSKIILKNKNILMCIANFQDNGGFVSIENYDLRLYSPSGVLIKTQTVNSYSGALQLCLLTNNNIAVAGGRDASLTGLKLSQFTVFDQNLNEHYTRNIGGYNEGDVFFKLNDSNNYYYLLGRTDDSNGDYDLPNNSSTSDMFYFKLEK